MDFLVNRVFGVLVIVLLATTTMPALPVHGAPSTEDLAHYTFEMYLNDFGKRYDDPEEYRRRRDTFDANVAEISIFNKVPGRSFSMGVNQFTDYTQEEFGARFNGRRSPNDAFLSQRKETYRFKRSTLPKSMTWQNATNPVLTPIKNQMNCGSCWAHAATECVESMYAIQTGQLLVLSTQQVTSCTENKNDCGGTGGCEGGTAQLGWEYINKMNGVTLEKDYPYTSGESNKTGKCLLNASMPLKVNVYSHVTLPHNDYDAVLEALATKGPLAVSVDASNWQNYKKGVFDLCGKGNSTISMDHAVQLVGYGTDEEKQLDYWIVRNSWGPEWGENGYIRLLRNAKENEICRSNINWNTEGGGCANDANVTITACGMCGILYDVSYPIVVNDTKRGRYVWIAGTAFGALGALMIVLFAYSTYCNRNTATDVCLLDESESLT